MDNLTNCEANYVPLTPITFLKRASSCYANRTSIIYRQTRFTWSQTYVRCCRLAASLISLNIAKNDVVSILAPNIPAMYEMHFAVPMAGAVLNPINTRLDAKAIAVLLRHAQPKFFFIDSEFVSIAQEALQLLTSNDSKSKPLLIFINEIDSTHQVPLFPKEGTDILRAGIAPHNTLSNELDYETLISSEEPNDEMIAKMFIVNNELDPISLNYTSGTTASPKGVVVSHRAVYLATLSVIMGWELGPGPVYLWALPMFHCNGWTITWAMAARGGTNVCMRNVNALEIYKNIDLYGVTHMCCVPTVFNILLEGGSLGRSERSSPVNVVTAGSAPPAALIEKAEKLGFQVLHAYGLTEACGPVVICEWQKEWNSLSETQQLNLKIRQGISFLTLAEVDVKNTETQESVPRDGKTTGEIVMKGSSLMKGYLNNPEATSEAFKHGWLNTGDIGVIHEDGYIQIKDRSKDIIISGGENISSIEVESVLYKHRKVSEAAVVAMPHSVWGETPCAFIVLKKDQEINEEEFGKMEKDLIEFCRENLSHFMCPKKVVFLQDMPKNGNGKILKSKLREIAKSM